MSPSLTEEPSSFHAIKKTKAGASNSLPLLHAANNKNKKNDHAKDNRATQSQTDDFCKDSSGTPKDAQRTKDKSHLEKEYGFLVSRSPN